jgi:hypothetical protein
LNSIKSFILVFASAIALVACEKKEQEFPIDPDTGCTTCTPSSATKFIGFLKAGSYTTAAVAVSSTIQTSAQAYFANTPVSLPSATNEVTVNAVLFNNDSLQYVGAPKYYSSVSPVTLVNQKWDVNGANGIPNFSFKYLKGAPTFTYMSVFPDTVRKSIGFAVVIHALENITAASLVINDGLSTPTAFSKVVNPGSDTLYITSENLSSLNTSTVASISLILENAQGVKIENQDFKFSKEAIFTKRVSIRP